MRQQWPMYSYLPARDVSRARQFYEQRLGWQPAEEVAGGVAYAFADGTRESGRPGNVSPRDQH